MGFLVFVGEIFVSPEPCLPLWSIASTPTWARPGSGERSRGAVAYRKAGICVHVSMFVWQCPLMFSMPFRRRHTDLPTITHSLYNHSQLVQFSVNCVFVNKGYVFSLVVKNNFTSSQMPSNAQSQKPDQILQKLRKQLRMGP